MGKGKKSKIAYQSAPVDDHGQGGSDVEAA